jgi:type I restriction enzyme S subunit
MPEAKTAGARVAGQRFKPYPAYKDSGVEWLGMVPAHWRAQRLKFAAQIVAGQSPPSEAVSKGADGLPFLQGNAEFGQLHPVPRFVCSAPPKKARKGDLLLSVRAPVGALNIADQSLGIGRGLCAIRSNGAAEQRFLYYLLLAVRVSLDAVATGSTYDAVSAGEVGDLPAVLASDAEQAAIAALLDRETARIDALVAKKERLVELLQEKRTALITRAVTKGLDPNVRMKDSGVEWLGGIPAHWEVKRLWHLTPSNRRIMYGIVLPGPNVDDGVPIVKGGDVSAERLRLDRLSRTTFEIESGYVRSRLRGGDLVFAIRGSIGEVAIVPDELEGANLTQDAARVAYTAAIHGQWLLHALKSMGVFAQLEAGALGATIRGINIRDLKRASIPVPPRGEQEAIAVFLEREIAKLDALVAKVREAIALLKEYRTALISAAVTGKIDVRGEAA